MIRATTKTGATYDIDGGYWRHRDREWHKIWSMVNLDPDEFKSVVKNAKDQSEIWKFLNAQEPAVAPEAGKRLYVSSREIWRISTEVVKVEEYDG